MDIYLQYLRIKRLLPFSTKWRVANLVPSFQQRVQRLQTPLSVYQAAALEINLGFKALSPEARDVLVYYLICEAAKTGAVAPITGKESVKNKLDSLSELGEMESLRLQMAMDRLSKLMSTLANLLKKASETQDSITQNLK